MNVFPLSFWLLCFLFPDVPKQSYSSFYLTNLTYFSLCLVDSLVGIRWKSCQPNRHTILLLFPNMLAKRNVQLKWDEGSIYMFSSHLKIRVKKHHNTGAYFVGRRAEHSVQFDITYSNVINN